MIYWDAFILTIAGKYKSNLLLLGFSTPWFDTYEALPSSPALSHMFLHIPCRSVRPWSTCTDWKMDHLFRASSLALAVGELMGCVQGRELGVPAGLAFQGLSCWEASLTLYLWFRFRPSLWLPFVCGFAVLKGLMTACASLQPSCY